MSEPLTKKVETLRTLLRTKVQFDELIDPSIVAMFTDTDKEFMEEFKKVYHIGTEQLTSFIDKLISSGSSLDVYSIQYYVEQLIEGPMADYVKSYAVDPKKRYFKPSPDILGVLGNTGVSNTSAPVFLQHTFNTSTDTYNKLTKFLQKITSDLSRTTSNVFASNFNSSVNMDNTLPFIDKRNTERIMGEYNSGACINRPHGNYMTKDVEFHKQVIRPISKQIFEIVKSFLGQEDYRLFEFKKQLNYFDSEKNTAKSNNTELTRKLEYMDERELGSGDIVLKTTDIKTDLFGNTFDSVEKRAYDLKVETPTNKNFKLYTVKGQLGSGEDVKIDPLTS